MAGEEEGGTEAAAASADGVDGASAVAGGDEDPSRLLLLLLLLLVEEEEEAIGGLGSEKARGEDDPAWLEGLREKLVILDSHKKSVYLSKERNADLHTKVKVKTVEEQQTIRKK